MDNQLKTIADNPQLLDAVKQVFLKQFSLDSIDPALTNAEMGEIIRAKIDGRMGVERALMDIMRHKTVVQSEIIRNPAR